MAGSEKSCATPRLSPAFSRLLHSRTIVRMCAGVSLPAATSANAGAAQTRRIVQATTVHRRMCRTVPVSYATRGRSREQADDPGAGSLRPRLDLDRGFACGTNRAALHTEDDRLRVEARRAWRQRRERLHRPSCGLRDPRLRLPRGATRRRRPARRRNLPRPGDHSRSGQDGRAERRARAGPRGVRLVLGPRDAHGRLLPDAPDLTFDTGDPFNDFLLGPCNHDLQLENLSGTRFVVEGGNSNVTFHGGSWGGYSHGEDSAIGGDSSIADLQTCGTGVNQPSRNIHFDGVTWHDVYWTSQCASGTFAPPCIQSNGVYCTRAAPQASAPGPR